MDVLIYAHLSVQKKKTGEADTSQDILLFDMEMSTTSSSEFSGSDKVGKGKRKDAALPLFSFVSISAATENFSLENKLGEGGFGPVYKVSYLPFKSPLPEVEFKLLS